MAEARPTTYTVYPTGFGAMVHSDKHFWTVEVVDGQSTYGWAIRRLGRCLNKDGEWEYESIPSERTDEFLERCRWVSRDEALEQAKAIVDDLRINGYTAQEASDDVARRLREEAADG